MKRLCFFLFVGIIGLSFTGCHSDGDSEEKPNNDSPRIKNYSSVTSPSSSNSYTLGANVPFEITAEQKIDSVTLDYRGVKQTFNSGSFSWAATNARTGSQRLKLMVHLESGPETHYLRIRFLSDVTPETYTYEVVNTFPHNTSFYTQGLFFKQDTLFESTGSRGESRLAKVNLTTGESYKTINLESRYFGEGSTFWGDKIIYLTWTSQVGFVYDFNLNQTGTFQYAHEGWGISTLGDTLVVSDGTEVIHFLNPHDYSEFDKLEVYDHEGKVVELNELEVIDGLIYANVYTTEKVVAIDPKTGKVLKEIDLSGLLSPAETSGTDVLNGIAYHRESQKIYVTGKLWPKLFEVEFIPN